ncbi:MAG: DotA/TraY family protein [Alphaproteobacteria bacterium]|nr:DotA/TraY family protein [Alphaproteobacteria bacterium]
MAPDQKPKKRSLFGLLFNPHLGASVSPLRESTKIFTQLLASVFAIYGLFPKDHPALRDQNARLPFFSVIRTAWQNVEFTREGLPRAIIFFAVVGLMAFSAFFAVSALVSVFIGHAHAATMDASVFTAPNQSSDVAQGWINYLFNSGAYPTASFSASGGGAASMNDPFLGSVSLQKSLTTVLALYSDAILIVAAIILFYHLSAMVVETAHHGVPMGKRASQIWAPIRLIVAIGLLVPINGGLNTGQYIVVKMAEMGSALASNAWSVFLTQIASYSSKPVVPNAPAAQSVAMNIILMEACKEAWNTRVAEITKSGINLDATKVYTKSAGYVLGNIPGTKYTYSSNSLADVDVCGSYFIPNGGGNQLVADAAAQQQAAITSSMSGFQAAAKEIDPLIPSNGNAAAAAAATSGVKLDQTFRSAIATYQKNLNANMKKLTLNSASQIKSALDAIKPYGWVMAGTFLNTIDRVQAGVSSAVVNSTPKTEPPASQVSDKDRPSALSGWFSANAWSAWWHNGGSSSNSDDAWNIRKLVAGDMAAFDKYAYNSLANINNAPANASAQCSAMVGLANTDSGSWGAWGAQKIFALVDQLATADGVWSDGAGAQCANAPQNVFTLGIQFNGTDPMTQIAYLGNANLATAFDLLGIALAGGVASGIPFVGGLGSAVASVAGFIAVLFWVAGFVLAFMVPLMPFMRFTFAVLSWLAGVVEAIIAIPLVALAHLNPEGDGLAGNAQGAYFFILNLFLRPILTVFGLVCGLILFYVAISFLNYGYGIAVAGAGGTSYGYDTLSKMMYSFLYVAIVYICANHAFRLIDHLPQHALSWMGKSGQAMASMGDVDKIEAYGAVASGYAGKELMGNLTSGARAIGKMHKDKRIQNAQDKKDRKNSEESARRHNQLIRTLGGDPDADPG